MGFEIRACSIHEVVDCLSQVPEFAEAISVQGVLARSCERDVIALAAVEDDEVLGVKLGYAMDGACFYSWIGGVKPDYRRQGIAQALLDEQEKQVWQKGYQRLRVKSMNHYPAMLCFLIGNDYQIIGTELAEKNGPKVIFEKKYPKSLG